MVDTYIINNNKIVQLLLEEEEEEDKLFSYLNPLPKNEADILYQSRPTEGFF